MTAAASVHVPVMVDEMCASMAPRNGGLYVDGTFGAGGYSRVLLQAADCRVIGIDRDRTAIAAAGDLVREAGGRLQVIHGRFGEMAALLESQDITAVDGIVLDIGVSSMQINTPERGFSFMADGPLDMRMGGDADDAPTAADIVNTWAQGDLAALFRVFGEERKANTIARRIVEKRGGGPLKRTGELADIAVRAYGPRRGAGAIHPATRIFQALRIFINRELDELANGLLAAERLLRPGGRLVVVAFHSLEDRIVKNFLKNRSGAEPGQSRHRPPVDRQFEPSFRLLFKGAKTPDEREIAANPRARSARLRAAERCDAPPLPGNPDALVPRLGLAEGRRS